MTAEPMPPEHERVGVPLGIRKRLVRAELLLQLGMTTDRWARMAASVEPGYIPFEQWAEDDPLRALCLTYDLASVQLAAVIDQLGDQLEAMAERTGYGEHWDPLAAWLVCDTGREHEFRPPDAPTSRCGRVAHPGEHRPRTASKPRCSACAAA